MKNLDNLYPKRIICLTEETTETLYSIGADQLIIGISSYTKRPPEAPKNKPKISRFLDAKIDKIVEMKPDIVLAWSDLQSDISRDLIKRGIEVICFNHRNIKGILSMILKLGSLVNKKSEAIDFIYKLQENIDNAKEKAIKLSYRPKVYFEEWYDPLISGIGWVSEIIEICGGEDIFVENRIHQDAKSRIIADNNILIERNPDIMIASWCGKPFRKNKVLNRIGWDSIKAIQNDEIYEIPAEIILQPGPAALTDGIEIISKLIRNYNR